MQVLGCSFPTIDKFNDTMAGGSNVLDSQTIVQSLLRAFFSPCFFFFFLFWGGGLFLCFDAPPYICVFMQAVDSFS